MSESSTTWFDLPTEVKDQVLENLFAGRLVLYGRMPQATDTILAILRVSKQFVTAPQVIDAMLRDSTVVLKHVADLNKLRIAFSDGRLSLVRKVFIRFDLRRPSFLFGNQLNFTLVKSIFPEVKSILVDLNDKSSHAIIRLRSDSFRWPKFAHEVPSPKGQFNYGIHPDCHLYWLSRSTEADAGYGMNAKANAGNDQIPVIGNAMMTWDSTIFQQHQSSNAMERNWLGYLLMDAKASGVEVLCIGTLTVHCKRCSIVLPLKVTFGTKDLRFRTRVGGQEMAIVRKIPRDFFDVSSATFARSACE
ncbi:hypothetical protein LTR70_009295 [Exophiala xenobiotica]|uniref:F-box domain-containing protein n=1 Tax=Lithohypha guttulata TaxID=1690604 RepID=A0ABR0JYE0_9EURO|nr:hypothetical protein LTR24_009032 [Lithohypha guttulata]KAK5310697.1 hypothetical protein LTR70_009295 [Exophiala xenobiotica]